MQEPIRIDVMRSQLGRVRGLGSARNGVHHWWAERVSGLALVPLTLWFIYAVLHLARLPQEAMVAWAGHPVNTVLLLSLIGMTFYHMQMGLQVIMEDYIAHPWVMTIGILANKAACLLLALMSAVAVLKMAL